MQLVSRMQLHVLLQKNQGFGFFFVRDGTINCFLLDNQVDGWQVHYLTCHDHLLYLISSQGNVTLINTPIKHNYGESWVACYMQLLKHENYQPWRQGGAQNLYTQVQGRAKLALQAKVVHLLERHVNYISYGIHGIKILTYGHSNLLMATCGPYNLHLHNYN